MQHDILARLPHQPPFRFVSQLLEIAPTESAKGVWDVSGDETFFQGHFPDKPLVPGVLLVEALAQLVGLLAASDSAAMPTHGRLAHVDVRFSKAVAPPARIMLTAKVHRVMGHLYQCEVQAESAGDVAAHGTLVVAIGGVQ